MKKPVTVMFNILLTSLLLAMGIDGFWGGITAGRTGATLNLIGAGICFLLLIASFSDSPPRDKS